MIGAHRVERTPHQGAGESRNQSLCSVYSPGSTEQGSKPGIVRSSGGHRGTECVRCGAVSSVPCRGVHVESCRCCLWVFVRCACGGARVEVLDALVSLGSSLYILFAVP